MKQKPHFLLALLTCLTLFGFQNSQACHRSSFRLDSITAALTPSTSYDYTIYATLSIGAGLTGVVPGGDGDTETFAFAFYGSSDLRMLSHTPQVTSDSTQATFLGSVIDSVLGAHFALGYTNTGGARYTCVTSTAQCGNAHSDTKQYQFTLNGIPDSIRALGIEGNGNPFMGCYPERDMLIYFATLPVEWGSVSAEQHGQEVKVLWTTLNEINTRSFEIERSADGVQFNSLGSVVASGYSEIPVDYRFTDPFPLAGRNYYRIRQLDLNGSFSTSEIVTVGPGQQAALSWAAQGANPVGDQLRMGVQSLQAGPATVKVWNGNGQLLHSAQMDLRPGSNTVRIPTSNLARGGYFLELTTSQAKLTHRFSKL